jgi:hypothetical protein
MLIVVPGYSPLPNRGVNTKNLLGDVCLHVPLTSCLQRPNAPWSATMTLFARCAALRELRFVSNRQPGMGNRQSTWITAKYLSVCRPVALLHSTTDPNHRFDTG